jgi:hypothetical protein
VTVVLEHAGRGRVARNRRVDPGDIPVPVGKFIVGTRATNREVGADAGRSIMNDRGSTDDSGVGELAIDAIVVVLVVLAVPLYLVFTLLLNVALLVQYPLRFAGDLLRGVWYQIVGTATLQRRLEGDILAAKGDVLRFALEIYEIHKMRTGSGAEGTAGADGTDAGDTEVSIEDIRQFKELIRFAEPATGPRFRLYLPGFRSVRDALRGRDLSGLFAGRFVFPLATEESTDEPARRLDSFPPDTLWALVAMELLNEAERNLQRNTETAFRAYLRAERYLVFAEYILYLKEGVDKDYKGVPNPLLSRAMLVYSSILPYGMREDEREFVADLLFEEDPEGNRLDEVREDLSIIEIDRALELLDQHRLESYRNVESLRVNLLSFLGVSALLIAATLFHFPAFLADSVPEFGYVTTVLDVTLFGYTVALSILPEQLLFGLILVFGAIGAAISGIRTIQHDAGSLESLQRILGYWLALARMMVGAISAFVVALFLFSGVVDERFLTLPIVLGTAIAAGFSERLLVRAIASFGDRAAPEPRPSDAPEREPGGTRRDGGR